MCPSIADSACAQPLPMMPAAFFRSFANMRSVFASPSSQPANSRYAFFFFSSVCLSAAALNFLACSSFTSASFSRTAAPSRSSFSTFLSYDTADLRSEMRFSWSLIASLQMSSSAKAGVTTRTEAAARTTAERMLRMGGLLRREGLSTIEPSGDTFAARHDFRVARREPRTPVRTMYPRRERFLPSEDEKRFGTLAREPPLRGMSQTEARGVKRQLQPRGFPTEIVFSSVPRRMANESALSP